MQDDTLNGFNRRLSEMEGQLAQFLRNFEVQDERANAARTEMQRGQFEVKLALGAMQRDMAAAVQDGAETAQKLEVVISKVDKIQELVSSVQGAGWAARVMWVMMVSGLVAIGWAIDHFVFAPIRR